MCIDLLAFRSGGLSSGRTNNTMPTLTRWRHTLQSSVCSSLHFHIAATNIVSVAASLLQYVCLSVVSLSVCLSLSSAHAGRPY